MKCKYGKLKSPHGRRRCRLRPRHARVRRSAGARRVAKRSETQAWNQMVREECKGTGSASSLSHRQCVNSVSRKLASQMLSGYSRRRRRR